MKSWKIFVKMWLPKLMAAMLACGLLAGCGAKKEEPVVTEAASEAVTEAAASEEETEPVEGEETETTGEEMYFIPLSIPDGAENSSYYSEGNRSVMEFDYNGAHYIYRAEYTNELGAYDMSGKEGEETGGGELQVGNCDAIVKNCQDATVVFWLDIVPGIGYTLECDSELAVEEILAVANEIFNPVQGDADGDSDPDLSGLYTDGNENSVELKAEPEGGYTIEITLYRLASLEGKASIGDGAVDFTVDDPSGGFMDGYFHPTPEGTWTLEFAHSDWDLLESGTTFEGFSLAE